MKWGLSPFDEIATIPGTGASTLHRHTNRGINLMRALKSAAIAAAFIFAAVTLADEANRTEIRIAVDDGTADAHAVYSWSGGDLGFDLHEMQEGESRSFVDDAGRSVLITREAGGMKIEVDGKTIHMPLFGGKFEHHAGAMAGNFDLQMFAHEGLAPAGGADDITIISGQPLDGSTQESIKSVLLSAGHDGDVRFVDKSISFGGALGNPHGDHHIKFVRKEFAVTQ